MNRRTFLKSAGATTVVVSGGIVWRASDRGVFSAGRGPAYEPWTTWRTDAGRGPLALVRAAILAASPHNTQPWIFRVTDDQVEVYADAGRNLGAFDPYLREMYLGLGCAVENAALAAAANGYDAAVTLAQGRLVPISEAPERPLVARLDLSPRMPEAGVLHDAIPHRHTNRGPYDASRTLSRDDLAALQQGEDGDVGVLLFTAEADRAAFGAAVVDATEAIIADEDMVRDSERWFRHGRDEVLEFRDGPTLDAAGLSSLRAALAKMLPRPSAEANHAYWLAATRDVHVATAPAFGLITVRDLYDVGQTLQAGRLWQRMHLQATVRGLAMQPLNQPVELVDRRRSLGGELRPASGLETLIRDPAREPTFAFRAGHAVRGSSASPRRAVEAIVDEGSDGGDRRPRGDAA